MQPDKPLWNKAFLTLDRPNRPFCDSFPSLSFPLGGCRREAILTPVPDSNVIFHKGFGLQFGFRPNSLLPPGTGLGKVLRYSPSETTGLATKGSRRLTVPLDKNGSIMLVGPPGPVGARPYQPARLFQTGAVGEEVDRAAVHSWRKNWKI